MGASLGYLGLKQHQGVLAHSTQNSMLIESEILIISKLSKYFFDIQNLWITLALRKDCICNRLAHFLSHHHKVWNQLPEADTLLRLSHSTSIFGLLFNARK